MIIHPQVTRKTCYFAQISLNILDYISKVHKYPQGLFFTLILFKPSKIPFTINIIKIVVSACINGYTFLQNEKLNDYNCYLNLTILH